jgi:predicted DNA-binding transcriptional regulator YafY
MRRADRLFDIIQILRTAKKPVTAADLAAQLEVTQRTVYRDMATLQARRIPIEGAAGFGYVLRKGFDLPPLMFNTEEIEAIALGVRMLARTGDPSLQAAADGVLSKVTVVLPEGLRKQLLAAPFFVAPGGGPKPAAIDLAALRGAIRDSRKVHITYMDEAGKGTARTIWPIAIAFYQEATLIGAWCELRQDYRHFRTDRIATASVLDASFPADNGRLMAEWLALRKTRAQV